MEKSQSAQNQVAASSTPSADGARRYQALFQNNRTIAISRCRIVADDQGQPINYVIEEVNEAYERILRKRRDEVEGRLATDVFPGIERSPFDFIGTFGGLGLHGGEIDCEIHLPVCDLWVSMYAYGSAKGECTALFTDVTAQKKAEAALRQQQAQLQAIIDNSPVLISMKNPQSVVTLANQALLDMVGASDSTQFVGRSVFDLFPKHVAEALWANDQAALHSRAPVRAEESVQDKDGHWRTYLTVKFPVRDTVSGEPYGVCAISTDVTEQKRADEERARNKALSSQWHAEVEARVAARTAELERALQAAEAANRAKSQFLATMSHEIRTPLNGVIGFTTLLKQGELNESKRRFVELLHDSGSTMLQLLNDFLDLAKIEAGHLALESYAFNPQQEINNAVVLVQAQAESKGLVLTHSCETRGSVVGDGARLRQILMNFLSNAIKFTSQGHVILRCTEVSRNAETVTLRIAVEDTGIGIDEGTQGLLFQPFVQAESTTARHFGGTGLGLSICKQLAESMGGRIGLSSMLHQGSTFWVEIPFGTMPNEPTPPSSLPPPVPFEAGRCSQPRVLLIDDNPFAQQTGRKMLTFMGCIVDVASSVKEALPTLETHFYHLVMADGGKLNGEDMSALRCLKAALAETGTPIPMVVSLAPVLPGDAERCQAAGADACIAKPLDLQDLKRVLGAWIKLH